MGKLFDGFCGVTTRVREDGCSLDGSGWAVQNATCYFMSYDNRCFMIGKVPPVGSHAPLSLADDYCFRSVTAVWINLLGTDM